MPIKVLFVSQDSAYPQMGVLYLMNALRQSQMESQCVPSTISEQEMEALILDYEPDVIGMSVMTAPQVVDFEKLSIFIKKRFPKIKVVWGGVHATLLADLCLQSDYMDYVFVGQAEELFPKLVLDIVNQTGQFPRKVEGYAPAKLNDYEPAWDKIDVSQFLFSERHSVRSPDVRLKQILAQAGNSAHEIFGDNGESYLKESETKKILQEMKKWDVGLYDTKKSIFYYLLTSRGCPYKCTFCSEPLQVMHGGSDGEFLWNAHSLDWVKRQIETVRRQLAEKNETLDGVGLWDDMFWVDYRNDTRAFDILRYFKQENLGYLIEARADQLMRKNFELFKMLAETGCIQVFIGAESASQETLNYMKKGTRAKDYYTLIENANQFEVALRMSFIVGFPKETDKSINETIDFCEEVNTGKYGPWVNVSGPKIFTPYPGTEEYDRAVAEGFDPPKNHVEWGHINRSTEEYLRHFPWFEKNCTPSTLLRLEKYFGKGHKALTAH